MFPVWILLLGYYLALRVCCLLDNRHTQCLSCIQDAFFLLQHRLCIVYRVMVAAMRMVLRRQELITLLLIESYNVDVVSDC